MTMRGMILAVVMGCCGVAVGQSSPATPAPATTPGPAAAATMKSTSGTWKVVGDVQGVPVILTCTLVEADHKLTGSCVDDQSRSHAIAGDVKDKNVSWSFDTDYQGTPITVSLMGVRDETGAKLAGTIDVEPMAVDGSFSATMQGTEQATS